ncbi:MAG: type IV conjugative transfer system protein TraL [Methylobacter sp.]|nr:MAG: type IV conjugative transfer system protein TraL [Methylobacter sp.]
MREIPNYLDDPQQILFWEFDEFIILSILFAIGIMADHLGMLLAAGLFVVKLYKKYKDRQSNGFLLHSLYWNAGVNGKESYPTSLPLAFIRHFY